MKFLDWAIVVGYLAYVIWDGIRMTKHSGNVEGYFLANRSLLAEAVNIFNTNSIFQFNNTVLQSNRNALPGVAGSFDTLVNPLNGELRGSLPDFKTLGVTSLDSRQFQLGFKFIF